MTKIILCADSQFDEYSNLPGKFDEDLQAFKDMYKYACNNQIEYVFHLGDLLELNNRILVPIWSRVYSVIQEAANNGIKTIIVPGNHELYNEKDFDQCVLRPYHRSNNNIINIENRKKTLVMWDGGVVEFEGNRVVCIPYYSKYKKILKKIKEFSEIRCNMLLGHFGISECRRNFDKAVSINDLNLKMFNEAFLGHIHKDGLYFDEKNRKVHFIGAMFQNNFGEEGNRTGFSVVDIGEKNNKVIHERIKTKRFLTIRCKNEEEYERFYARYEKGYFEDRWLRVDYGGKYIRHLKKFPKSIDFSKIESKNKVVFDIKNNIDFHLRNYVNEYYEGKSKKKKVLKIGFNIVKGI